MYMQEQVQERLAAFHPSQAAVVGPATSAHSFLGLNLGQIPSPNQVILSCFILVFPLCLPGRCPCLILADPALFPLCANSRRLRWDPLAIPGADHPLAGSVTPALASPDIPSLDIHLLTPHLLRWSCPNPSRQGRVISASQLHKSCVWGLKRFGASPP